LANILNRPVVLKCGQGKLGNCHKLDKTEQIWQIMPSGILEQIKDIGEQTGEI
jgi:hypothetical protein